ncbi:MAG: type II secretion system major pseudopilin GspG [Vulcanimicrobiota bacterium]
MKRQGFNSGRKQKGFTFLEIIVVVAILLLLATIVVVNYGGRMEQAKIDKATIQISELSKALELYRIDNGFYPSTDQGLDALKEEPDSDPEPKKWKEYLDTVPRDPWDNEYIYIQPGTHKNFDLFSYGPDGVESEDDITNWNKEDEEN